MTHSSKLMWGCVAVAVLAVALTAAGFGYTALFVLPCMLMMGAMMWMMMRMGDSSGGPKQ